MTEQPRDWNRELADIDRAIARQQPGTPVPGAVPPATPAPPRRAGALTWLWTGLGLLLAFGLLAWPYPKSCGLELIFFLAAIVLTVAVGVWGALASWRARRGVAHGLSLLVVGWAGVLGAGEVLPRVGYARESRAWLCPKEPAPAPAPPAPQPQPQPAPAEPAPSGPASGS